MLKSYGQTNFASISPGALRSISRKLDANLYINGSITEANSVTCINAKLHYTRTNEVIKSFKIEGYLKERDAFQLADTLS